MTEDTEQDRKIRILIAKPGLDGPDVGAKVVVRGLMAAGFEVIYTGLRKTPEEIAQRAKEENVDVIGLSILSGSHTPYCKRLRQLWDESDLGTKMGGVGGNVPEADHEELRDIGVDAVFNTGTHLDVIADYIKENVSKWPRN